MDPRLQELNQKITDTIMSDPDLSRGFEIRMSTAGFCQRQMDYDFQYGKRMPSLKTALRFDMGDVFHLYWQGLLSRALGPDYVGVEEELNVDISVEGVDIQVQGHCDGRIISLDAITEVKSVSDNTFTMIKNQDVPIAAHYEQGNIYAYAAGVMNILFIYTNRDTGDFWFCLAPRSDELAQSTMQKWVNVYLNKKYGRMTPRPYNDMTGAPCFYCDHKEDCYKDFRSEIAGMFEAKLEGVVALDATEYRLTRRKRLDAEKKEEELKTKIINAMISAKIKAGSVDGVGSFEVKVGKNNNSNLGFKESKDVKSS